MFTEEMIAPCGLDCSLCGQSCKKEAPCPGCLGADENKPDFCSTKCTIIQCEKRKNNQYRFCDECPDFPCAHSMERENRYMSQYKLKESPFTNLKTIRAEGMEVFLQNQRKTWTCKECGGIICVHDGICSNCKKQYE